MTNTKTINQQTYDAIAPRYEENYGEIPAAVEYADYVLDQIKTLPNPRVMDLGCGTGTLLKLFEAKIPSAVLIGVDFSQELLNIAKSKLTRTELVHQDFALYEPRDKFDVVIATFSLIHSTNEELEKMFSKIYSWLNTNGYFYVSFILGEGEQMLPEALDPRHKTYFNFHSKSNLLDLCTKNNFKVIKQKIFHSQDEFENEDDIYIVLQK